MAIDQVTSGLIKDAAVTTAKVADDAVTAAKIPAGAVVADVGTGGIATANLADDAVTQAKMGAGAIGTTELAADAVDGTKIADDAVNSEHYAAGSIDTAHIADDQVTGAKIENNPTIAGNLTVVGSIVPSEPLSHRNLIINGDMQIWQRARAATAAANGYNTVDRWSFWAGGGGSYTCDKHSMTLAELNTTGHTRALKLACTGTDTINAAADFYYFTQKIEAAYCQHLQWGTANAKTLTLSFWVKSSKTGTYCATIQKEDTTGYVLAQDYTISSANTWEKKTLIISPTAGSTSLITAAGGVINNDTGAGISINFALAMGTQYHQTANTWVAATDYSTANQTNWMDSTSNTFYITGVQLELGSVATPFEYLRYTDQLFRCRRYYNNVLISGHPDIFNPADAYIAYYDLGVFHNATEFRFKSEFPTEMRAVPSIEVTNASNHFVLYCQGTARYHDTVIVQNAATNWAICNVVISGVSLAGLGGPWRANTTQAKLRWNAEL